MGFKDYTSIYKGPVEITRIYRGAAEVYDDSPAAPTNTVAPSITGTATVGQTLTAAVGAWTGSPGYARQWLRNGTAISGATGLTYLLIAADQGASISVRITATNAGGSAQATSAGVGPVAAAATAPAQVTSWTWTTGLAASQIVASITAPSDGGSAITGYEYSLDGGTTAIPLTGASPWTLTMAAAGTSYTAVVRARNAIGAGTWSTSKTATSGSSAATSLSLSASASTITLGQTVTITGTAANTASTDFAMFGAVIDGVTQAYTSSAAFSATITPDRTGTMTVQASVAGLSTPVSVSVTVSAAAPTLSINYLLGSLDDVPAEITINRAGTVYWALSTAPTMTASAIIAGTGAAQHGNYVSTSSGPFTIPTFDKETAYYLHAFLRVTGPVDSAVATTQVSQPGVSIAPTALAGWNFTTGAMPANTSVSRAGVATAIASTGLYATYNADTPRIHYGQQYPALLMEPWVSNTEIIYGQNAMSSSTQFSSGNSVTMEEIAAGGRYNDYNTSLRKFTFPTARTSTAYKAVIISEDLTAAGYREFSFRFAVKPYATGPKLVCELHKGTNNLFAMTASTPPAATGFGFEVDFSTMSISRMERGTLNPTGGGWYLDGARVYASTPGWYEVEFWGVYGVAAATTSDIFSRMLFGSDVDGAAFALDEWARMSRIVEGLSTPPTSYDRPCIPRTNTGSAYATRAQETLTITQNVGACDVRITGQFRTIDLTNQNLNGAWTWAPTIADPIRVYKIEAFPVGGLPA